MWVMQPGISDDLEVPLTEASIYSRTVFVLWEGIYHVYSDLLRPKPVTHHQIMKSGLWKVTVSHWPATVCHSCVNTIHSRQIGSCTESFQMFKLRFLMKKKKKDPLYILINALEINFNTGKPWSTFQRRFITQLGQHTSTLQYFFFFKGRFNIWLGTGLIMLNHAFLKLQII